MDHTTAQAFAESWNNLPQGSVYTPEQFTDWLAPLTATHVQGKTVLELGCGNGSLLVHMTDWKPSVLHGVDLGDSVLSARKNMASKKDLEWRVYQHDLAQFNAGLSHYDITYCIGVLHHMKYPLKGLDSLIRLTKPGGHFHVWVYAREGNSIIVYIVDPIRKLSSRLPWWFTKYFIATPLVIPFYLYAKSIALLARTPFTQQFLEKIKKVLPLYEYSLWIAKREFAFFRHVAFDQLVTPQTVYISKDTIKSWLDSYIEQGLVEKGSEYIIMRNGNSWKFGAKKVSI